MRMPEAAAVNLPRFQRLGKSLLDEQARSCSRMEETAAHSAVPGFR